MKKRGIVFISLLLLCLLSISCVSAQDNGTDILTDDSSEQSSVGTFNDLSQLIADSNGTVELDKDYKYVSGDSTPTTGILINKPIVINGNGFTIDASESVRAFQITGNNVTLKNINLINGRYSSSGGTVYWSGSNGVVDNCTFDNGYSRYQGGAIYWSGSNGVVNNSIFKNGYSYYEGGAICWAGTNGLVNNSQFMDNFAADDAGAIYWLGNYGTLDNSRFSRNTATGYYSGGAVYWYTSNGVVTNSVFENNKAGYEGGLFYRGNNGKLSNLTFISNYATQNIGGAVVYGSSNSLRDTVFINNTADSFAGGLYLLGSSSTADNITAVSNNAATGGGVVVKGTNNEVKNSYIADNNALYGGGGVVEDGSGCVIDNCTIVNNTAGNYGGGIYLQYGTLKNSIVEDNTARHYGGGVYGNNPILNNVTLNNNDADVGREIYTHNNVTLIDTDVPEDAIVYDSLGGYVYVLDDNTITHLMKLSNGYYAYCAEHHNGGPSNGYADSTMKFLRNAVTGEPIADYLKILVYETINSNYELRTKNLHDYVWEFTDEDFRSSQNPIVQRVISLYDAGFRINGTSATKTLANGTVLLYNFSSLITGTGQQNLFTFQFEQIDFVNETLTKETINKTVLINQYVEFNITARNTINETIYNVFIEDKDYSEGLQYVTWRSNDGNWTYDEENGTWMLASLEPFKTSTITVIFLAYKNGTFYNNATGGSSNSSIVYSFDVVRVYNANFTVEKIALNQSVELNDQTMFEIVVHNTGEVDLHNVTVYEMEYDGLIYDSYIGEGYWNHSVVDGKHVWKLNYALNPNQYAAFKVIFNTTAYGNFTNVVVVSTNETENKTANNTTRVLKPGFAAEKITLTPEVVLGSQVEFQIIVRNTGETNLTDVRITEDSFEGLIYDSYVRNGYWNHSIVSGKHTWTLNGILLVGEYMGLDVVYNTTREGNFTNIAVVSTNETDNKTVNNTTTVLRPDFEAEKITLTPEVVLGSQVEFQILVRNTGEANLTDVTIVEESYEGLVYDSYIKNDYWTHSVVDGKHTWTLNSVLVVGEVIGLDVVFNSTKEGNFTNVAVIKTNETDNKTVNNTTTVLKPDFEVQKITLTPEVALGSQVEFNIVVRNTGEADLTDVTIVEESYEGLVYDSYIKNDYWTHSVVDGKHTWTFNGVLAVGEVIGLDVIFNSTKEGNFTNVAVVKTNETENKTVNNTTTVLKSDFIVEKITLTPFLQLGEKAIFEIVVHNVGECELSDVFVIEDEYDGLVYDSFVNTGNWKHSFENNRNKWVLNRILQPNEFAILIVHFKTTRVGNCTNVVVAGSNTTGNKSANNTTEVFNDNETHNKTQNSSDIASLDLIKTAVTPKVVVGNQVTFEIIVHNTGNVDLHNVTVKEESFEGLVYDHFYDYTGFFIKNDDLSWTMNSVLYTGEYAAFFVVFNTTTNGTFTNVVSGSSNETNETTSNDTVDVLKPDFTIEKIALDRHAEIGDKVTFEIVVHNTGETVLENLTVSEYYFEGLEYDSYTDYLDVWMKNSDLSWTMNSVLHPGEYSGFFVTFISTTNGTFINVVTAKADGTDNKSSNDTVNVYKGDYVIEKIALNDEVIVGSQVMFEIVVRNTGETVLENITVSEDSFEGLVYDSFVDSLGVWIKGEGLTWTYSSILHPGEYTGFFVVFNTTTNGTFMNVISSGNKTANDTVKVLRPDYEIEKISLTREVVEGDQATFEIVIRNTGETVLENITVSEDSFEGLVYDSFVDSLGVWIKGEGLSWTYNSVLHPGEYTGFFVVFNTTTNGTFMNVISSENKTANDTVKVLKSDYVLEKIVSEPVVLIGDYVTFEIVIHNTGEAVLHNITISELSFDGLIYDSFMDYHYAWKKNDDLSWTLITELAPDEYAGFIVKFNTTETGTFINIISSGNKTTNDTVKVVKPEFSIEKIAVNSTVNVGDDAVFEIVIQNTGIVNLTNVVIKESYYEGLVYDSYYDGLRNWTYNNMSWTLNGVLEPGEFASFFVVFKTYENGTFFNTVEASTNETPAKNATDQVVVIDNRTANLTVSKLSLNRTVKVGETTVFEITVTNNGEIDLDDVFVIENYDSGLTYLYYYNGVGNWSYESNKFTLNGILKVGESATFYVVFNTTSAGNFTNTVLAGFGNNTFANATNMTEVVNEEIPEVIPDNETNATATVKETVLDNNSTGNPLLLILLVLLNLAIFRRRD